MTEDFKIALYTFVEGCQIIHTDYMARAFPNLAPNEISATIGKRYVRVVSRSAHNTHRSVHCFVDTLNGNVLKAASWKAPAKHARGNIFDGANGLGSMGEYGPAYLR